MEAAIVKPRLTSGALYMASLTIRGLDPAVEERLRARAARHGRSIEDEVKQILGDHTAEPGEPESLADIAQRIFGRAHGVDLELPPRQPGREPPQLG